MITADGVPDMFSQLNSLGVIDVEVHCGHCLQTFDSPTQFSVHLLTCECINSTHNHRNPS